MNEQHVVITGGAGYIGSLLARHLLEAGYYVSVVDDLLFGGESLMGLFYHPRFHFYRGDVTQPRLLHSASALRRDWPRPAAFVHLAAIVGFPACQAVGRTVAWKYNVEAVERVYGQAVALGARRFIFSSTYSNYGLAPDGAPVDESSPLTPQSLYAETKIAAEEFLRAQAEGEAAPLIFRFATLYGLSPRTRFDLIVNQFVLEAFSKRELIIYQRGYSRSFVHIHDVVRGIRLGLEAPEEKVRGQVYNLGTEQGNLTKDEIVGLVIKRLPETVVRYKDLTFGGDMRDITVSFAKIRRELGFAAEKTVDEGVREVLFALKTGLIKEPWHQRYRNARFIVQ